MTLIEQVTSRIRRRPAILQEVQKPLTDLTLHAIHKDNLTSKEYRTGLPFDIKVSEGGFALTRLGPPFNEEQGIRVFLIDNQSLDKLYSVAERASGLTPEIFYRFLKMYERKNGSLGRHLALNKCGTVNIDGERMRKGYTLIIKKVDHPTKEKYRIPDEARLRFTPERGFESQTIERVMPWFEGRPLDLTKATRDVISLNIKEPHEQPGLRDFLRVGGYDDEEITKAFEKKDEENGLFTPNHNTLIIKSLRESMGSVPAPPVDMKIFKDDKGILVARLNRKSGVDGISLNGQMHVLAQDKEFIEVPLTDVNNNVPLIFWFDAGSDTRRRKALVMNIHNSNGHVIADFVSGIDEMPILPYNPSAGISMQAMSETQKKTLERSRAQRKAADERKKLALEEAEMGTSITVFEYNAKATVNGHNNKDYVYHEGDERKLSAMVEELRRKKIVD
jgi:hypothetical protein